jgi:hypothetical protein
MLELNRRKGRNQVRSAFSDNCQAINSSSYCLKRKLLHILLNDHKKLLRVDLIDIIGSSGNIVEYQTEPILYVSTVQHIDTAPNTQARPALVLTPPTKNPTNS